MKLRESFTDYLPHSGRPDLDKYDLDSRLPLNELPSTLDTPTPTQLQLEDEMVAAATHDIFTTGEAIRLGQIPPAAETLHRLGYDALLLARTDLIAPLNTASTLAVATADLHAVKADRKGDGLLVATLFNKALDVALPNVKLDPRQELEAQAYRAAVKQTTPELPFEAALENEWARVTKKAGWRHYPIELNGVGYTRLIPPEPKQSPYAPKSTLYSTLKRIFKG